MATPTELGIQLRNEIKKTIPHMYGGGFYSLERIKALISAGADIECTYETPPSTCKDSPLMLAVTGGVGDIVHLLLEAGAKTEVANFFGTPLVNAAQKGAFDIVWTLLHHKADINAKCWTGHTALMHAAINGHEQIIDLLLLKDADTEITNKEGMTAAMLARQSGQDEIADSIDRMTEIAVNKRRFANLKKIREVFAKGPASEKKRKPLSFRPKK